MYESEVKKKHSLHMQNIAHVGLGTRLENRG